MNTELQDDPFDGFPLEQRIVERAGASGITLTPENAAGLAEHAREVLRINPLVQLTSITTPAEYLERHLGESFEGAAMLEEGAQGLLLDLGSGNGYPGFPVLAARQGLELVMAEASSKKAEFLRGCARLFGPGRARVLEAQVQRAGDLGESIAARALVCRAMGNWSKVLPRLASVLAADGEMLLWGGADVETVSRRAAWSKLRLAERKLLPGRERSWIWRFRIP